MNKVWRILLTPLYPLLIINAFVAYVYAVLWCRAVSWKLISGTLTFIPGEGRTMVGNPGGQGWSWIVGYASEADRDIDNLRCHENVHVWQELMFALGGFVVGVCLALFGAWGWAVLAAFSGGPIWAVTYGITFLINFARTGFADFWAAYRAIPFERHAYRVQDEFVEGKRPGAWI